jgi:4-hydroxybenzoate polyprenyltransferase
LFFVLAIVIGYAASPHAALFVAGVICVYQVYSASGTRLKLVPIVPSFLIGIACVFAFSIGFFTGMPHAEFADIPRALIILIFCGYTLGATIRDLKDYEGDKAGGALTIPVLFGKKWGAIITGIAFSSSLLLAPLLFNFFPIMFLFSAPVAFLGFWLTVRSPYKEWPLFILYLLYFSFLFTLWVLQNIL